jgi:RHS repeat-associated protein
VRDAAGNVMATYAQTMEILPNNIYTESLEVNEWIIYGSSRVGVKKAKPGLTLITGSSFRSKGVRSDGSYIRENYTFGNSSVGIGLAGNGGNTPKYKGILSTYTAGLKQYELTNHLGNVMSVVTDRKTVQLTDGNTSGFNYQPDVVSATDYYPFGSAMPERSFNSNDYVYGFNGMRKDDEISGSGNSYDFGARMYNPRLGRWFAVDKLFAKYVSQSPYHFAGNNPIINRDYDGNDYEVVISKSDLGNTMTISATFYTGVKGSESHNEAVNATSFWNSQNGKFEYSVNEANGSKTVYDVVFELDIKESTDAAGDAYSDDRGNSIIITADANVGDGKEFGETSYGFQSLVAKRRKDTDTGPHEVGHVLNLGHFSNGLMQEIDNAGTITRESKVTNENVQQILDFAFGTGNKKSTSAPATEANTNVTNPSNAKTSGGVVTEKKVKDEK